MRNFQDFLNWEDASDKTIKVKLAYVDMAGDLAAGVVLSQIVYWHLPSKKSGAAKMKVEHNGLLWIAKARADWWSECRVTARQMDRVIAILKEKGLIEIGNWKFNGAPMLHVRIVEEKFLELWESVIASYSDSAPNGFYESVKLTSPNRDATSRNGEVDFTQSVKSYSTKSTTKNTSKNNNNKAPVVVDFEKETLTRSNTQSEDEIAQLATALEQFRITPDGAQVIVRRHTDRARLCLDYWRANGDALSKARSIGAAVRSSIESPDKWPQIAAWRATPAPTPVTSSTRKPRAANPKIAAAAQRVFDSFPANYRKTVQKEKHDVVKYVQQFHANELAAALRAK